MPQISPRIAALKALLTQRIVILDGAMGTMIQQHKLDEAAFRGERFTQHTHDLKGNNDLLTLTQPPIIAGIHRAYLEAGADLLETNTFNATTIAQADYALESLAEELNRAGAQLARSVATEFEAATGRPAWVAGVLGPTNRTASISPDVNRPGYRAVDFAALVTAYTQAIEGLMTGGADLLLVETIFDTLNAKAALYAIDAYCTRHDLDVPIMISGTITDASGRLLSGQTVEAFWNSIAHAKPMLVGFNCALGAADLRPHVEELSRIAPTYTSVHPNAGLPNPLAPTGYDETPEYMAGILREFAQRGWLNVVGGCCGTTPEFIRAIAEAVRDYPPRPLPAPLPGCRLSGLEAMNITPGSLFVNVGERTNITGSAKFRKLILAGDYETALQVARDQVENGAQIIDINMDEAMLDAEVAMPTFLNYIASEPAISRVPVMIDSSKWSVIEAGLR